MEGLTCEGGVLIVAKGKWKQQKNHKWSEAATEDFSSKSRASATLLHSAEIDLKQRFKPEQFNKWLPFKVMYR